MKNRSLLARLLSVCLGLLAVVSAVVYFGLVWAPVTKISKTAPHLELVGRFTWQQGEDPRFGGFSGLEVYDNGRKFVALSDRPALFHGTFQRDDGRITGVSSTPAERIISDLGVFIDELGGTDTEGLAMTDDGRLYVSIEGFHVVNFIEPDALTINWVAPGSEFATLPANSGLEAVTLDPDGRVIAIPELDAGKDPFPVYRLAGHPLPHPDMPGATRESASPAPDPDAKWSQPYTLRRDGGFVPVGADTGPDNRLYLLERKAFGLFPFSSRVRSFAFTPDGLTDEHLLLHTHYFTHDNLEGLSVWQDDAGDIRITMISDDNFNPLQKTEFVEYRLRDGQMP